MNNNRNMYFYDVREGGVGAGSKPNPEPVIYQCDKFQYIDKLSLNRVDTFNPNLLCYIPEFKLNNNNKYDRVKYFLEEDGKVIV